MDSMISQWAHYKRLLELCASDAERMRTFIESPAEFISKAGLSLDAENAKEAIESQLHGIKTPNSNYYLSLIDKLAENNASQKALLASRLCTDNFFNQEFKAWFKRQNNMNLFGSHLIRRYTKKMRTYSTPVCYELTDGCSGRCPFCCLSPKALEGIFYYNENNDDLWINILSSTKKIIGDISGTGMCYFATDPFDNPDYEKFILDFKKVFGYYPHTTTVKAIDDLERTKSLMRMLGEEQLKNAMIRFSVISKKQLEKIHQAFTPEELAYVDLTLNNPESLIGYSLSGRAVNLKDKLPDAKFFTNYSPICTIGFVVNMYRRTIMLVTPKNSEVGMKIYETTTFSDVSSYEDSINKLIAKWMKAKIPPEKKINPCYLSFERIGNNLKIQGDKIHRMISVNDTTYESFIRVMEGCTLNELFIDQSATEHEKHNILELLQFLYENGYIDIA